MHKHISFWRHLSSFTYTQGTQQTTCKQGNSSSCTHLDCHWLMAVGPFQCSHYPPLWPAHGTHWNCETAEMQILQRLGNTLGTQYSIKSHSYVHATYTCNFWVLNVICLIYMYISFWRHTQDKTICKQGSASSCTHLDCHWLMAVGSFQCSHYPPLQPADVAHEGNEVMPCAPLRPWLVHLSSAPLLLLQLLHLAWRTLPWSYVYSISTEWPKVNFKQADTYTWKA